MCCSSVLLFEDIPQTDSIRDGTIQSGYLQLDDGLKRASSIPKIRCCSIKRRRGCSCAVQREVRRCVCRPGCVSCLSGLSEWYRWRAAAELSLVVCVVSVSLYPPSIVISSARVQTWVGAEESSFRVECETRGARFVRQGESTADLAGIRGRGCKYECMMCITQRSACYQSTYIACTLSVDLCKSQYLLATR